MGFRKLTVQLEGYKWLLKILLSNKRRVSSKVSANMRRYSKSIPSGPGAYPNFNSHNASCISFTAILPSKTGSKVEAGSGAVLLRCSKFVLFSNFMKWSRHREGAMLSDGSAFSFPHLFILSIMFQNDLGSFFPNSTS